MYFTPIGPWNTPTPGGATSAAQKIPLATAPVTMTEEETYAEYLWRERTESGGEVDKAASDIRASDVSDVLPTNECNHMTYYKKEGTWYDYRIAFTYCPKCGEKL